MEREQVLTTPTILAHEWRQGRRVGRCIHMMVGTDPSEDDVLIGVFDDPALAEHIVALHNARLIDGSNPPSASAGGSGPPATGPANAGLAQPGGLRLNDGCQEAPDA